MMRGAVDSETATQPCRNRFNEEGFIGEGFQINGVQSLLIKGTLSLKTFVYISAIFEKYIDCFTFIEAQSRLTSVFVFIQRLDNLSQDKCFVIDCALKIEEQSGAHYVGRYISPENLETNE